MGSKRPLWSVTQLYQKGPESFSLLHSGIINVLALFTGWFFSWEQEDYSSFSYKNVKRNKIDHLFVYLCLRSKEAPIKLFKPVWPELAHAVILKPVGGKGKGINIILINKSGSGQLSPKYLQDGHGHTATQPYSAVKREGGRGSVCAHGMNVR